MAESHPPSIDRRYEYIAKQIEREDGLYQTRMNFLIIINLALSAAAVSQLKYGPRIILAICVCGIALAMTRRLNLSLYNGKLQLQYLRTQFFDLPEHEKYPRPFHSFNRERSTNEPPKKYGTFVFEILCGWWLLPLLCICIFVHYYRIGWLDVSA